MRFARAILVLVLASLLVPTALASHNMGHRYLVYGRILDADGFPVQNQDIEIRLLKQGQYQSSLVARTDCLGDFDSWKAIREGPPGGASHGGGEIEGPFPVPGSQNQQYYNFHFHDEFLSSLFSFELRMLNETWAEDFNSRTRQTSSFHQLGQSVAPACGNFDVFNSTLEVRVFVSHVSEMTSAGDPRAPTREFTVRYDGKEASGTANFVSTYVAILENVTVEAGSTVQIEGTTLGRQTITISEEQAKFRRVDSVTVVTGAQGGSFKGLMIFGIIVLIAAALVALYYGGRKYKAKREEARLMQGATRRRFRKQQR